MSISVFIGSSFKEMSYRKRIGNRIRQLNDVWEQIGVRIYLKQWEDFRVQYSGKSKPQEIERGDGYCFTNNRSQQ